MARKAREVIPGTAHHVVQRGNRRQKVFFQEEDKQEYLNILSLNARLFKLRIWAYCLMDNHVHLIAVPEEEDSMTRALSLTHQLYTRMINFREGWRGYLWEGRYKSKVLDERHLYAAMRYVERNPVRAGIVKKAENYRWSSAKAHASKQENRILAQCYLTEDIPDWKEYLQESDNEEIMAVMRKFQRAMGGGGGR